MVFGILLAGTVSVIISKVVRGGTLWTSITLEDFRAKLEDILSSMVSQDKLLTIKQLAVMKSQSFPERMIELKRILGDTQHDQTKLSVFYESTDIYGVISLYNTKPCALIPVNVITYILNHRSPTLITIPLDSDFYYISLKQQIGPEYLILYNRKASDTVVTRFNAYSIELGEQQVPYTNYAHDSRQNVVFGSVMNLAIMCYLMEKSSKVINMELDTIYGLCLGYSIDEIIKHISSQLNSEVPPDIISHNRREVYAKDLQNANTSQLLNYVLTMIYKINEYIATWNSEEFNRQYQYDVTLVPQNFLPQSSDPRYGNFMINQYQ
jgi:hypothetical protein